MKIKRWIKAGVLTGVFLIAIVISSFIINRGTSDLTVDLGDPTLPRISFEVEGRRVNTLAGYVDSMDITAMRDAITPLADNGTLQMKMEREGNNIEEVRYEAYSLDGESIYDKGEVKDVSGDVVQFDLKNALPENIAEAVLKVTLKVEKKQINFYTRIAKQQDLSIKDCLAFAADFHSKTFDKKNESEIAKHLEYNGKGDNTTFETVTIDSNSSQVTWGSLAPQVSGNVEWSIKESNSVYTSLLAAYQVTAQGDQEEVETYNIKEFFRVRYNEGQMYLLNYNRSMAQVFNENKTVMNENGILLGITPSNITYETNKKETVVSFVQERELWVYNRPADELSLAFSFGNKEGRDARSRYDQHKVSILSMDENGSTAFAVYGYMNRGPHEGEVGVEVYYFDIEKNTVEEKAFIPSNKSFPIAEDELGKMVYYSPTRQMLYVLAGGKLYQVNLENNKQEILAENLEEGQYTVSDDGHLIAYQIDGALENAKQIKVFNLKDGKETMVEAKEGESIRPLGFVINDFVYGHQREQDKGETVTGEALLPMYGLEIRDTKNKIVKTYAIEDTYISDVFIENNLVTLNRVTKSGNVYSAINQDYISNNEDTKKRNITLEVYTSGLKKNQRMLAYAESLPNQAPKILRPKQVMLGQPATMAFGEEIKGDKYYVYGMGELVGIYDRAVYAIEKAEKVSGVVISTEQSYIWEKGNRDLIYNTDVQPFKKADNQTSIEVCEEQMKQYGAKRVNLTGCSLSQVLYVINQGLPIIAMTNSDHAILLTGYSTMNITYIDPDSGEEKTAGINDMEAMVSGSGNTFIGFVK